MCEPVRFRLDAGSYEALYGTVSESAVRDHVGDDAKIFVVSDTNVWRHHGTRFQGLGPHFVFEAGEESKGVETWARVQLWLVENGANRNSSILAVGGGVVSDLAGFAAATYMRGIRYATIATTLLAQVDAALGGKTGINLKEGKNLVGRFHHPTRVWCDAELLITQDQREFRSGLAEVVKYGLIMDDSLLRFLEEIREQILARGESELLRTAQWCGRLKAEIVGQDPEETKGRRAILNFGHTVGHALEAETGYTELTHGEAVSIGMVAEAMIGEKLGISPEGTAARVRAVLEIWGLPTAIPAGVPLERLTERMYRDKKAGAGEIAASLLDRIGSCRLVHSVPANIVHQALVELS